MASGACVRVRPSLRGGAVHDEIVGAAWLGLGARVRVRARVRARARARAKARVVGTA